jgi:hypothetical protein
MKLRLLKHCTSLCAIAFGLAMPAQATILQFGGAGQTSNVDIPQSFGDFVTAAGPGISIANGATPDIDLSYDGGSTGSGHWEFYNDAEWQAAQLNAEVANSPFTLTFTPNAGKGVIVDSFILDNYASWQGGNDFDWELLRDSVAGSTIAAGFNITVPDGDDLLVNTGMTKGYFGPVVLRLTIRAGADGVSTSDVALDDIAFRQVPEPATALLAGVGLMLAGVAVWRRK